MLLFSFVKVLCAAICFLNIIPLKSIFTLFIIFSCKNVYATNMVHDSFSLNKNLFVYHDVSLTNKNCISLYGITNIAEVQKKIKLFSQSRGEFYDLKRYLYALNLTKKVDASQMFTLASKIKRVSKNLYKIKNTRLFFNAKAGISFYFPSPHSSWSISFDTQAFINERFETHLSDISLIKDWMYGKSITANKMRSGIVSRGIVQSDFAVSYSQNITLPYINTVSISIRPKLQRIDTYKRTVNLFNYTKTDYYSGEYFLHKNTGNIDVAIKKKISFLNIGVKAHNLIRQHIKNTSNEYFILLPSYELSLVGEYKNLILSSHIDLHKNNSFVDKKDTNKLLMSSQWLKTNIQYHMKYLDVIAGYEKDITYHHVDNYSAGIALLWPKQVSINLATQWNKKKHNNIGVELRWYI